MDKRKQQIRQRLTEDGFPDSGIVPGIYVAGTGYEFRTRQYSMNSLSYGFYIQGNAGGGK